MAYCELSVDIVVWVSQRTRPLAAHCFEQMAAMVSREAQWRLEQILALAGLPAHHWAPPRWGRRDDVRWHAAGLHASEQPTAKRKDHSPT